MKKLIVIFLILLLAGCSSLATEKDPESETMSDSVQIEKMTINSDKDGDGILDLDDIVEGARLDVANQSKYKNAYYAGGYPPDDEGVCTDLVWRALRNAGYDLKSMIDSDIAANEDKYPRVTEGHDPNIDFRRVPNLTVFFERFGTVLTKQIIVGDVENLREWQGGDLVMIENPQHVGIISDKRNPEGVPYVIHNMGPIPREEDCLEQWSEKITGHFRYPSS